jgi:hypothetical protein
VRCDRRYGHEKWPLAVQRIIEEAEGFLGNDIRRMASFIAHGSLFMSLIGGVHVRIGIWIHEEIGSIKAIDMGTVIILDRVSIEELARVVGVIARFLEPDRQKIIVKSPFHKFGVST